jgi:hypothetical protein
MLLCLPSRTPAATTISPGASVGLGLGISLYHPYHPSQQQQQQQQQHDLVNYHQQAIAASAAAHQQQPFLNPNLSSFYAAAVSRAQFLILASVCILYFFFIWSCFGEKGHQESLINLNSMESYD